MVEVTHGKKGGLLTAWLIILLIGLIIGLIVYLFAGLSIQQAAPGVSVWIFWVLTAITVLNIVSVGAIFKWKRWGFYGFGVLSIATFVISLSMFGFSWIVSIFNLGGLVILILLVIPRWNSFE